MSAGSIASIHEVTTDKKSLLLVAYVLLLPHVNIYHERNEIAKDP
jgi:hypothetical protein